MATDIASLGLEVQSDQVAEANLQLRAMPAAASAAERAVQKWGLATDAASASNDNFSKRVRKVVTDLDFQRAQLARTAAEQERYAAVRRAGVTAESAAGQAVMASVAALQAQRAAAKAASGATAEIAGPTKAAAEGYALLLRSLGPLAAAYSAAAIAHKLWDAGMKAGDLGEQAEQVNLTTDQLQAYRFAAIQNGVEVEKLDQAMVRLTASMGAAFRGGEDQIKMFERLGVKLLDSNGELRATGDVLPELARGLLTVSSATERNAIMTELLGKSGSRMVTMLKDWAGGNDKLIASARAQGGILETEIIEAWDRVSDSMKRAGAAADVTYAKLGAPIAIVGLDTVETVLGAINRQFDELAKSVALINTHRGVFEQIMEIVNILTFGIGAGVRGKDAMTRATEGIDRAKAAAVEAEVELQRLLALKKRTGSILGFTTDSAIESQRQKVADANAQVAAAEQVLAGFQEGQQIGVPKMPPVVVTGASNPVPKGQVDAWDKIIAQAKAYAAQKQVEAQAVGLSAEAAARMTHEQELLNKATEAKIALGPTQIAQIKELAAAMAAADASLKSAKFMDEAVKNADQFIQQQQVERDTLYMSTEAAMAYRLEQEAINRAKAEGIQLGPTQIDQLKQIAAAQAAAAEQTRRAKEWVDFEKETFKGFFADTRQGLREGQSLWDALGNAAMNALNKIADKLLDMALNDLWNAAFPGGSGGGGGGSGFLGGLLSFAGSEIGGLFGGPGFFPTMAKGGVFDRGNIVPFARGGIVGRPTLFPMANGMGLMGEAGPEAVMPLRRGPGGRLGVEASGGGGAGGNGGVLHIYLHDELLDARVDGRIAGATPAIVRKSQAVMPATMAADHAARGGEWRG